ncbi:MAG: D-allulose 6-phosphate 3-epimerase [Clostridia bacterium]|nr:D-allulose 6-phosphate 3-epimerase [Clostridia bacterium]
MRALFSPSLMCADILDLRGQLSILNLRADFLHADIMDGHFCPNIALSPDMIRAVQQVSTIPIEAHLMTTAPNQWIPLLADCCVRYISVHAETIQSDAFRTLRRIEALGCGKGAALNPATPLDAACAYLDMLDLLTIMTVDPGYAGQKFISQVLSKISRAREEKEKHGYTYLIQVDGACNPATFKLLRDAGAEVFVLGSSGLFLNDPDLNRAYDLMLARFEEAAGESAKEPRPPLA